MLSLDAYSSIVRFLYLIYTCNETFRALILYCSKWKCYYYYPCHPIMCSMSFNIDHSVPLKKKTTVLLYDFGILPVAATITTPSGIYCYVRIGYGRSCAIPGTYNAWYQNDGKVIFHLVYRGPTYILVSSREDSFGILALDRAVLCLNARIQRRQRRRSVCFVF